MASPDGTARVQRHGLRRDGHDGLRTHLPGGAQLRPGHLAAVVESQRRPIDQIVVLINNVQDVAHVTEMAQAAVERGEITGYALVADHLDDALRRNRLRRSRLGARPYLVDYGLVMPDVVSTRWLLGWDAEGTLVQPINWIDPALDLLRTDPRVFHVSLNWPKIPGRFHSLERETWEQVGPYRLNYGFSDQIFLVDRVRLARTRLRRRLVPVALTRHAAYPYSFEFRVEAFQRAHRLYRATRADVVFTVGAGAFVPGVLTRTAGTRRWDRLRIKLLLKIESKVLARLPRRAGPTLKR